MEEDYMSVYLKGVYDERDRWKSKVKEKIEELEKEKEKDVIAFNKAIDNLRTHDIYTFDNRISVKLSIIEFLEELLES